MNSKKRLVFQAFFAFGLLGQLCLLTIHRRLMVHHHDIIQIYPDIGNQLLGFSIDGVAVVQLRCGWGNQPLVAPSPLVAAFGGTCDFLKLDIFLTSCDALRCGSDDLVAQGDQILPPEVGKFLD